MINFSIKNASYLYSNNHLGTAMIKRRMMGSGSIMIGNRNGFKAKFTSGRINGFG
jgi:hypothetical protein